MLSQIISTKGQLMGGIGSRRYGCKNPKDTVETGRALDVRSWQRQRLLKPGCRFSLRWLRHDVIVTEIGIRVEPGHVLLSHRDRRDDEVAAKLEYSIPLDWTPCHFGGGRYWFRCPTDGCGRRVAILHLGDPIFACRHCLGLGYQSQRERAIDRGMRRIDKINRKLGGGTSPVKPKRMRWHTYQRLLANADATKLKMMWAVLERVEAQSKAV